MTNISAYYTEIEPNELDEALESGRRSRFMKRLIIFSILALIVVVCALVLWRRYCAPIDLERATVDKQAAWLVAQDFSKQSSETREQLFDMYVGKISAPSPENAAETVYKLPDSAKKIAGVFLSGRDEKTSKALESYQRAPYLRVDYVVSLDPNSKSQYLTSSDVKPSSTFIERWNKRQAEMKDRKRPKRPKSEKNIQLLAMQWFVAKYKTYDAAPDPKKKATLDAIVLDLENLQTFYNELRASAGLPKTTRAKMLREFELTADSWMEMAEPDELAKVYWFKDLLVAITVAKMSPLSDGQTTKGPFAFKYPPLKPAKEKEEKKFELKKVKELFDSNKNQASEDAQFETL